MFKLVVVSGPSRGSNHSLNSGENTIGRVSENSIVLNSQKVSKRHCSLTVNDSKVLLQDFGSSNGTYVNGILTKSKILSSGDRISIGEFVFELVEVQVLKPSTLPGMNINSSPGLSGNFAGTGSDSASSAPAVPSDLKGRIKEGFEQYVINFLYNLNEKHEWRHMIAVLGGLLVFLSAIVSVYPVLNRTTEKLEMETKYRASLIARQIVDRNTSFIFQKLESKVDVTFAEREPGVLGAYVVDMEGRIIAPGRDLNKYLTEPDRASFSALARQKFSSSDKSTRYFKTYSDLVAAAEPVRIFNPNLGKNVTVALALVFFDRQMLLFDPGTIGLAYITAVIFCGILGILIIFSLYKITIKPLEQVNSEIDQILKGNSSSAAVSTKFKMEEISPLIDVVNAALQRAITSTGHEGVGALNEQASIDDDVIQSYKFIGDKLVDLGLIVFSSAKTVAYLNPFFEEVTGIRSESVVGQDIQSAARDSAFAAFVEDILGRTSSGASVSEDFEFSGTNYNIECFAVGPYGTSKGYIITAQKGSIGGGEG